jgi:CheY-like chemotaxis protein
VVDDALVVRRRLAARVREAGGDPVEIADAEQAIAATDANAPDLVILDVHLPGMSGLAALPRIKARPKPPVVVMLTGQPSEPLERECLARGADYFLDKSADFDRIVEIMADVANDRGRD